MATRLVTADTSVVVPLVSSWHEAHAAVRVEAREVSQLPAHVLLEAVAVLTRLPRGLAVETQLAVRVLRSRFPEPPLIIDGDEHAALLSALVDGRIRGGQVYDALVATTAKCAGAVLLTRDRRAEPAYRAIGVETRFLN